MRLFLGIPLPESLTAELSRITLRHRSSGDNLRWYPPESWHITLQFLGSVAPAQYSGILMAMRALHHPPVPVALDTLGFFDRTGVFFAQVTLAPELLSLEQRIVAANASFGFATETRPYNPHITLARTKGRSNSSALSALKARLETRPCRLSASFTAPEFVLYESIATPSGSRYEIRDRFLLK